MGYCTAFFLGYAASLAAFACYTYLKTRPPEPEHGPEPTHHGAGGSRGSGAAPALPYHRPTAYTV